MIDKLGLDGLGGASVRVKPASKRSGAKGGGEMKAIYTVPPMPCRPDWRVFLQQLDAAPIVDHRHCAYCGAAFPLPTKHSNKEYCSAEHQRRARYVRQYGREPHSPRDLPKAVQDVAGYRGVHIPVL